MKWLSAGLAFVNVATVCALLLGTVCHGLSKTIALVSFIVGGAVAIFAYFSTRASQPRLFATDVPGDPTRSRIDIGRVCFWFVAGCFAFFAFRSFGWLLFWDGNQIKVQSPNNLGDLSLHITYIKNFASGVPLWPENPIHVFSKIRYPAGIDLFNGLLVLLGFDLTRGLIWVGWIGSFATFWALYRWGGTFTAAGFLFNGGLAGFQILKRLQFLDFQGDKTVAWKSLPLAMFVTQRGLLYALPAGLLLLYQWRAKYRAGREGKDGGSAIAAPLPFWLELSLYATMPLFHLHTFMALSIVAAFFFVIGDSAVRKQLAILVGAAVVPATLLVWTITDHFEARSLLAWKPGWVQGVGDFAAPFFQFWLVNFGVFIPLALALLGACIWRAWKSNERFDFRAHPALAFLAPGVLIFLFACLVKTAPWEWDNIKLLIWAYLIFLPFLWAELIVRWPTPVRIAVCFALFGSGFVSLFGGLTDEKSGFGLADRAEVDAVAFAVRKLPLEARFATFPTYNHPLLLQGRKVVLGYPGHLWTQGFDYAEAANRLTVLMQGSPDWREQARHLRARYLFWGREEKTNYATSTRPWEREAPVVASGEWGAIYDLEAAPIAPPLLRE